MDIDKAIRFVRIKGDRFEQARLQHTLGEKFDAEEVLSGFCAIQNPDGGFPYGDKKGFPSCLSNTTMALTTLIEMGLADSEPANRGITFLLGMRRENGTWEENPKITPLDPPFWDMPGDDDTTLWLTAATTDILLRSGRPVPDITLNYLRAKQGKDGRFAGFYHTTWIALSIFGKNGTHDRRITSLALAYLESADIEDWDCSCIAWCLESMKNGGVKKSSDLWNKLFDRLSETQEEDGSWTSEGGEELKIRDTNSVLAAVMDIIHK